MSKGNRLNREKLQLLRKLREGGYTGPYINVLKEVRMMENGGPEDPPQEQTDLTSFAGSLVRGAIPAPTNVRALIGKKVTGDSYIPLSEVSENQRYMVMQSVGNAIKRTGKNKGGTEYRDYPSGRTLEKDINGLNVPLPNMILGTLFSDEFNAATTYGRVSYDYDPETGEIKVFDSYDFSKTPEKNNAYGKIRQQAGESDTGGQPHLVDTFNIKDLETKPFPSADINYDTIVELGDTAYEYGTKAYNALSEFGDDAIAKLSKLFTFKSGGYI